VQFDKSAAGLVEIDIREWVDETLRDEQIVATADEVMAQIVDGVPLSKVARNAVVSRQGGAAPDDLLAPNRTLLHIGAYKDARTRYISSALKQVEAANGKVYDRMRFVGGTDEKDGYADTEDEAQRMKALAAAVSYLTDKVPGHTWRHLVQVYALDGDVVSVAEQLKAEIDDQVKRLIDPDDGK